MDGISKCIMGPCVNIISLNYISTQLIQSGVNFPSFSENIINLKLFQTFSIKKFLKYFTLLDCKNYDKLTKLNTLFSK